VNLLFTYVCIASCNLSAILHIRLLYMGLKYNKVETLIINRFGALISYLLNSTDERNY